MQPYSFIRLFCLFALFGLFTALAEAQTRPTELQRDLRPRNCSISGRVTINGQPSANVQVSIFEIPLNWDQPPPIRQTADGSISRTAFKTRTDSEGRYQMINLPPGRYMIRSASKAFVAADANLQNDEPKMVTLDAGESRENVNFSLVRGGVITGQITDSEGRPVIAHSVRLFHVIAGPDGQLRFQHRGGEFGERMTDDRGIYRIYGLPAGKYGVGAGGESDYFAATKYPPIFYPDASDEKQAKFISVKAGEEVTGINIRLGMTGKTFEAVGRVVEADTGKPVPNVNISSQKVFASQEAENADNDGGSSHAQADRQGNFRLTGLKRGKYSASIYAGWMETTDFYAEPTTFDITDDNISGLEIKAVRGGVISGIGVIEGSADPAVKSKLAQVQVFAYSEPPDPAGQTDQPTSHHQILLKPDGTFLITGVAPGKVSIGAHNTRDRSLNLTRIERDGAEVKGFIELAKGEKVTDLRLVFSVGTGVIRGQVQVVGDQKLLRSSNYIEANLVSNSASRGFGAPIDEKGRFEMTNLPNGEYELRLSSHTQIETGNYRSVVLAKQRVTVSAGAETRITITYDPNRKEQEER